MASTGTEYYPPRAGAERGLRRAGFAVRRWWMGRPGRRSVMRVSPRLFLIWLVPGYGIAARGNLVVGAIAFVLWGAAGLVVLIFLGKDLAAYATAVMVGIHATGFVCAIHRNVFLSLPRRRLGAQVCGVLLLVILVYAPGFRVLRMVAFPVETRGEVVVLNGLTRAASLDRGDMVGYRIDRRVVPGGRLRSGYGFDEILALPGDRVVFAEGSFSVNGQPRPAFAHMPVHGETIVPEDHWFIWPSSIRAGGGGVSSRLLFEAAVVPRSNVIGPAYERWFWRKFEQLGRDEGDHR